MISVKVMNNESIARYVPGYASAKGIEHTFFYDRKSKTSSHCESDPFYRAIVGGRIV